MLERIEITTPGIKKHLRSYTPERAIAEYVWNGFDAGASKISIFFEENGLKMGGYDKLTIKDDGIGIDFGELKTKFKPYFDSQKKREKERSLPHGQNGYGRFTFISFATRAEWSTVFVSKNGHKAYSIGIEESNLEDYDTPSVTTNSTKETGTEVSFSGIELDEGFIKSILTPFLKEEFGWFLFLYPDKSIVVSDKVELKSVNLNEDDSIVLDHEKLILTSENGVKFDLEYVQWPSEMNKEYSRIYYIDGRGIERYKETTKLNKKGDGFHHSVFVRSPYFENFSFRKLKEGEEDGQQEMELKEDKAENRRSDDFMFIDKTIVKFLKEKRKPFVRKLALKTIEDYETNGIITIPSETASSIEKFRYDSVKEMIAELYQIEPRIFGGFNIEQKKTFVGLLATTIESGNAKDNILKILEAALHMEESDREELAEILDRVSLRGLLEVAKLIDQRYRVYEKFKEVILDDEGKSYEKDVQVLLEENLWIIDEEYHLVAAEEDDFEVALRKLLEFRSGKLEKKPKIASEDKKKQVDILACRQMNDGDCIKHIVVELKRPGIKLSKKHWDQLVEYERVISGEARFNSADSKWMFYLIGSEADDFIVQQKQALAGHGDRDLVYIDVSSGCRGYALSWSQIFDRFKIRHDYLKARIDIETPKATDGNRC